jgi:hypothetical protein
VALLVECWSVSGHDLQRFQNLIDCSGRELALVQFHHPGFDHPCCKPREPNVLEARQNVSVKVVFTDLAIAYGDGCATGKPPLAVLTVCRPLLLGVGAEGQILM